jgi:hypothetical protein
LCHYFDLTPKWPHLNINTVRDFLKSAVGRQIIDLTFNNEARKAKANLSKLLIPKIFNQIDTIPDHIAEGIQILRASSDEILNLHPSDIEKQFAFIEKIIGDLSKHYPMNSISLLSAFKTNIDKSIELFGIQKKSMVNFNNPVVKTPLLLSKTSPLYPSNKDLFFEFNSDINQTFDKVVHNTVQEDGFKREILELYNKEELVLTIDSGIEMIQFLDFIFSSCKGTSLAILLKSIEVPSLEDLSNILKSFNLMKRVLREIADKLAPLLERILIQTISSK